MEEVNSGEDINKLTWAIIGNKCDLKAEVMKDSVKLLCEELGTPLEFLTSAKDDLNVRESFDKIVRAIHTRHNGSKSKHPSTVDLGKETSRTEKSRCC